MTGLTIEQLTFLMGPDGETLDVSLSNGILCSSKELRKDGADSFTITHEIDFSQSYFSRSGIEEVFRGERDLWDGDLGGYNADEDREFDADGNWLDDDDELTGGVWMEDEVEHGSSYNPPRCKVCGNTMTDEPGVWHCHQCGRIVGEDGSIINPGKDEED